MSNYFLRPLKAEFRNVGLRVSGHVIRSSATLCIIRHLLIVVSFIPRHVYGPFCDGDLSFSTV